MKGLLDIILTISLVSLAMAANIPNKIYTVDSKQYYIEAENKYNWFQAQSECTRMNMSLLTVDTPQKANSTQTLLIQAFKCEPVPRLYIGAYDLGDFRNFIWIASGREMTFNNWLKAEPNNFLKRDERCVHMGHKGTDLWNDINCYNKYGFICENFE